MPSKTILLVVIVLALGTGASWWWYSQRNPAGWRPALSSREVATRVLGEYLAQKFPAAKALVIGNPFTQRSGQSAEIYAFERAGVEGLEHGFGSAERIKVVYPGLRPEFLQQPESVFVDPKTTTPLSFLVADNALDQLVQAHPGFPIIVSLIGLPVSVTTSQAWSSDDVHFGLLLPDWRMIGGPENVRDAFNSKKIVAAVIARPGAPAGEPGTHAEDYRAEFERRFILVTSQNIDELLQVSPQSF